MFCSFHYGNFVYLYFGHLLFVYFLKKYAFCNVRQARRKNPKTHYKENHETKVRKKMTKIQKIKVSNIK